MLQHAQVFWQTVQHKPLFGLLLSLVIYQLALKLYITSNRNILAHPLTISAVAITLILRGLDIPFQQYLDANQLLYFLLGPATVALAIPLHQEFHNLRKLAGPVLVTVILGGAFASICAVGIAWLLGASDTVLLSLAPKSVTTPIALGIAEIIGAHSSLTTGVVAFTGIAGALMSPVVFYCLRIRDPQLQGIVLGINAHALGTARSFEINPTMGAFASLAMGLTGVFTALALPYIIQYFG
jgi:putative effector of murein hydrolase